MPDPTPAGMGAAVRNLLFADRAGGVFAVLDGASVGGLREKLHELQPEHVCLYRGELQPDIAEVAPYLVRLEEDSPFADWVIEKGWGNHWGVFAVAPGDLLALRQHFRRFLTVYDESGKPLLFRYYDPRVLRVYLPTCKPEELKTVFGPVEEYVLEGEEPAAALRFRLHGGALRREETALKAG